MQFKCFGEEDSSFESSDLIDFNKELIYSNKEWNSFSVNLFGVSVNVNLVEGNISVNDVLVDLGELPDCLSGFKPINFKRVEKDFGSSGYRGKRETYGVGWQCNLDGLNFHRFIMVDKNGNWVLECKR